VADDETLLAGSGDHHGVVRRVGDTVVRPVGDHTGAVHALLKHLEAEGFDGAPRVVYATEREEALTFLAGEVPVPPEPPSDGWIVVSTARAVSVGLLLARFHHAARTFTIPKDAKWRGGFTPGVEHTVVCHNDPVIGNVVFRGDEAVALIDFDFAGPNDFVTLPSRFSTGCPLVTLPTYSLRRGGRRRTASMGCATRTVCPTCFALVCSISSRTISNGVSSGCRPEYARGIRDSPRTGKRASGTDSFAR